jgi:hypothetical protein
MFEIVCPGEYTKLPTERFPEIRSAVYGALDATVSDS